MRFAWGVCLLLFAAVSVPTSTALIAAPGGGELNRHRPWQPANSNDKPYGGARKASLSTNLRIRRAAHRMRPVILLPNTSDFAPAPVPSLSELTRGCTVMEARESAKAPCRRREGLKDWCLPLFKDMDAIDLMADASKYIRAKGKSFQWSFLSRAFRNFSSVRRPENEVPHYIHNHRNNLGMKLIGPPGFKLFVEKNELPKKDLPDLFNFTTCAVVGSSQTLLDKTRGKDIDSHSVVFRTNQAPTKGYQKWVGSRSDIRVTNAANSFFSEDGRKTVCLTPLIPKRTGEGAVMLLKKKIPSRSKSCRQMPVSPQFEAFRWTAFQKRTARGAKPKWSSGFSAIVLAVQLCQTVDIYGFTFKSGYYYDKTHNGYAVGKDGKKKSVLMREPLPGKVRQNMADIRTRRRARLRLAASSDANRREEKEVARPGRQIPPGSLSRGEEGVNEPGRRRLQAMSRFGHPWGAEKQCTTYLAKTLPKVKWHQ